MRAGQKYSTARQSGARPRTRNAATSWDFGIKKFHVHNTPRASVHPENFNCIVKMLRGAIADGTWVGQGRDRTAGDAAWLPLPDPLQRSLTAPCLSEASGKLLAGLSRLHVKHPE